MSYFQDDGSIAGKAITVASQQSGKPYIWGAAGPDTFDCSGLVHYAYSLAGLPGAGKATSHLWTTASIQFLGDRIPTGTEQPGDLVLPTPGHVGIAIGNGKMWNAPETGIPVRIDNYKNPYMIRRLTTPATNVVLADNAQNGANAQQTLVDPLQWLSNFIHVWNQFSDAIHSFDNALKWLANPHNMFRIGEVVAGSYMIYFAVRLDTP